MGVRMKLECKPDFDVVAERWEAFWRGQNERPMVGAEIPRAGVTPIEKPGYAALAAGDLEPVIDRLLAWAETHEFLGDSIPFFYLEFAADHFASLLGADLDFPEGQEGGWAVPFVEDLDRAEIRFDRDGKWWRRTLECAEALRARCDGKLLIASPSLVANLDALSAIYGPQKLLFALVDNPDGVQRELDQIDRAFAEIVDAFAEMLDYGQFGSINRHGMYTRGRTNVLQCDFSYMISPEMFREFVVPHLAREMEQLDAVEYHLDGPGAIRHVEALCEMERLDVVQWVAGAGGPAEQDWIWLYDRIDELGKGQFLGGDTATVKARWAKYRSRKLYFRVRGIESDAQMEEYMETLESK